MGDPGLRRRDLLRDGAVAAGGLALAPARLGPLAERAGERDVVERPMGLR